MLNAVLIGFCLLGAGANLYCAYKHNDKFYVPHMLIGNGCIVAALYFLFDVIY